jgi:general secretion pathway protein G
MKTRTQRRGFTLMEVLLVLAILVVLGSLVTVSFVRLKSDADVKIEKSQVNMLEEAVNTYVLAIGTPPTSQQGLEALLVAPSDLKDAGKWRGPYVNKKQLPVDPWSNTYQYEPLGPDQFRIWSNGPDGADGTQDDVSTEL